MVELKDLRKRGTFGSPAVDGWVEVEPEDLIAAVRRGVESGTIKGEVKRDVLEVGDCYLVIPVSDGGSET